MQQNKEIKCQDDPHKANLIANKVLVKQQKGIGMMGRELSWALSRTRKSRLNAHKDTNLNQHFSVNLLILPLSHIAQAKQTKKNTEEKKTKHNEFSNYHIK